MLKDGKRVQVGFELHLFAQHEPEVKADPGCIKCQEVYAILREIARISMPRETRPTRYDIGVFDASFHLRPENNLKTEVQLTILIVHRSDFLEPVNHCEKKCIREIEENLRSLGIKQRVWSEPQQIRR
jgi:hypothetical protein